MIDDDSILVDQLREDHDQAVTRAEAAEAEAQTLRDQLDAAGVRIRCMNRDARVWITSEGTAQELDSAEEVMLRRVEASKELRRLRDQVAKNGRAVAELMETLRGMRASIDQVLGT